MRARTAAVVLVCILCLAASASADTTIFHWHHATGFASDVYLVAKSDSLVSTVDYRYYKGSTLQFTASRVEDSSWLSQDWRMAVTDTAGNVYVNESFSDGDSTSYNLTISGDKTLRIRVWGYWDGLVADSSYRFVPDSDGPTFQILPIDSSAWRNAALVLSATNAQDTQSGVSPTTWQYKVGAAGYQNGSSVTVDGNGEVPVTFRVSDKVGNVSEQTVTLRFDKTAPPISVDSVPAGWSNQDVVVGASSFEDTESGRASGYPHVSMSGAQTLPEQMYTGPVTVSLDGVTTITFINMDAVGNTTTVTRTVKIDKQRPVVSFSDPGWLNHGINVNAAFLQSIATETDQPELSGVDASTLTYEISGPGIVNEGPFTFSTPTLLSLEGQYALTVNVKDFAGNPASADTTIRIDLTAPQISLPPVLLPDPVTGITQWSSGSSFEAAGAQDLGSGIDDTSWGWIVKPATSWSGTLPSSDDSDWRPGQSAEIPSGQDGIWYVWYRVANGARTVATSARGAVKMDRVGPQIKVPVGWTTAHAVTAFATDLGIGIVDVSSWQWSVDQGATWQPGQTAQVQGSGAQAVWFKAADTLGNSTEGHFSVTVDDAAPTILPSVLTSGASFDVWTSLARVDVGASFADDYSGLATGGTFYNINGGVWTPWTGTTPLAITSEGATQIGFRALDVAGNEAITYRTIQIDRSAPGIALSILTGGVDAETWTSAASVMVQATLDDAGASGANPSTLEYRVAGGAWVPGDTATVSAEGKTMVEFRGADIVGNAGSAQVRIWIDRSGPQITAPVSRFMRVSTSEITVGPASAVDAGSGVDSAAWQYAVDGQGRKPLPFVPGGGGVLFEPGLSEGQHDIVFYARDQIGNEGLTAATFVVDMTPPVVGSISLADSAGALDDLRYSGDSGLQVTVDASDSAGMAGAGSIAGYRYLVQSAWTAAPDLTVASQSTSSSIEIRGLSTGTFYLYAAAVDAAGNVGAAASRALRIDTSTPSRPALESLTHARASTDQDASPFSDAVFLISPAATGLSGAQSYRWSLARGSAVYRNGTVAASGVTRLELLALPDNDAAEYYELSVWSVSGNGRESGTPATYRFRVDTQPPRDLTVSSATHANPEAWYPSARAVFVWNRPLDMTGVRSYYTLVSPDPVSLPSTLDGWNATDRQSLEVDLRSALSATHGEAWLGVVAEDFAGNRQFSSLRVRFDVDAPTLGTLPSGGTLDITTSEQDRSAAVVWAAPSDANAAAGVARVEAQLSVVSGSSLLPLGAWRVFGPGAGLTTFEGLDPSATFRISVRAVDAAGNASVHSQFFTLTGAPPSVDLVAVPFTYEAEGFVVSGTVRPATGEVSGATLSVPAALGLTQSESGTGTPVAVTTVSLSSVTFQDGQFVEGSSDPGQAFSAVIAGYPVSVAGLRFSAASGLSFDQMVYTATLYASENSRPATTLTYSSVGLTYPPLVRFLPTSLESTRGLGFMAAHPDEGGSPRDTWLFSVIGGAGFDDSFWALSAATLDTSQLFSRTGAEVYTESSGTRTYGLSVSEARITPSGDVDDGTISGSFTIRAGGNLFVVQRGVLRGDRIVALQGTLLLPEGFAPRVVAAANYSLDTNGKLHAEAGFAVAAFSWTDAQGNAYAASQMSIQDGALVVQQGTVSSAAGGTYDFLGLRITDAGPAWDLDVSIPGFEATVAGFRITSTTAHLTEQGILIPSGFIEGFPVTLGGGRRAISGLGLRVTDLSVYQAGTGSEQFGFTPPYGAAISVGGLSLEHAGLFANNVEVPLPSGISTTTAVFQRMPLGPDGTIGISAPREDALVLTLGPHTVSAEGATFDGAVISAGQSRVTFAANLPELVFTGLSLDSAGVAQPGTLPGSIDYTESGWSFSLSALTLDGRGVWGIADTRLPAAFGSRVIQFSHFALLPSGGFLAEPATDTFFVRIGGWKVELSGITVSGPLISALNGTVRLYASMGGGQLAIPDLVLRSDGSLASSGAEEASHEFLAENGFVVQSTRAWLRSDGLSLSGKVFFPSGLGENVSAAYDEMDLGSDGCIETPLVPGQVTYYVAGWAVRAEGFVFNRDGLQIAQSYLTIPNANLIVSIPALSFYADGTMQAAGQSFEGFDVPLFGGGIGVSEISLTEDGLNARAYVALPPNLGGATLYFDQLTFHPDGTITSDVSVREFGFQLAGLDFLFRNVRLGEEGLMIGEGIITLPTELESRQIRLVNFSIDTNGSFELGGLSFDPFQLYGYTFEVANIGFSGGVVSFEGYITLPDSFPEGFAGRTIAIQDFRFTTAGEVLGFQVTLQGDTVFPLTDEWQVVATDIGIGKDADSGAWLLTVNQGTLVFPPSIPVDDVAISGVKLNPLTGEFRFDQITISGVSLEQYGMTFHLTQLAINSSFDMAFSGWVRLPDTLPGAFAGLQVDVTKFQISHDGVIGDVVGSVSGIDAPFFDTLRIYNATVSFSRLGSELTLGGSGEIQFVGAGFPDFMVGRTIHLDAIEFNLSTGQMTKLAAASDPLSFRLFQTTDVENAVIGLRLAAAGAGFEASVSGSIVLPQGLPAVFAGKRVTIGAFRVDVATGQVKELSASFSAPGESELFQGVDIRDALLGAELASSSLLFRVNGTLVLTSAFPQGLAGTECAIQDLRFDSAGAISTLDARVSIPTQNIYDVLTIRNGAVAFSKQNASELLISLSGEFVLPESFPQGLAGLVIQLNTFTFSSSGQVLVLDAGASGINAPLFGVVDFQNGFVTASNSPTEGVIFSVGGDLVLPSTLPGGLAGMRMGIQTLRLSTRSGLLDFRAGLTSRVQFELFAGIIAGANSLIIGKDGFSMTGDLTFPSTFPEPLPETPVVLTGFSMGWDGTIRDIQGGIGSSTITLGGFTTRITNLIFHPDRITLDSCIVTLPANMNGMTVGVRNASWDRYGNFHGEFILPVIQVDVAGFSVALYEPSLDVQNKRILVSRAELRMPAYLGSATLALNGVSVGASGMELSGAQFRIPDFTIAGGLGFKDVFVNFSLSNGQYLIEGGGKAFIPGAGTFGATVSFVNVSSTYPWGLKRALFSYEVYGLGLPLGTTGLYLNGIRGGLAFGPPDELPQPVQWMFDSGTRIQLGLTMYDVSKGNLIRGDVDMWVDVTHWGWAFEGQVSVLTGYLSADVVAAITGKGFYGSFSVYLTFVKGRVEVYIYDQNGTQICGSGSIQFGLRTGSLVDFTIDLGWFGKYRIQIPWSDWWLPSLNAEFGRFTSGDSGFKGWVDVPAFGQTGVFVPRGGSIVLGGVSQYTLIKPTQSASSAPASRSLSPNVRIADASPNAGASDTWAFTVPGASTASAPAARALPGSGSRALSAPSGDEVPGTGGTSAVERLVFAVAYAEGDPVATAVSPSGLRYTTADPNTEIIRTPWGMLFVVMSPEPGQWSLEVTGVLSSDSYQALAFGKEKPLEVAVDSPAYSGALADAAFSVSGIVRNAQAGDPVRVFLSRDRQTEVGEQVGETTVDAAGHFALTVDSSVLADGEYAVFAAAASGDNASVKAFAPGSIVVRHQPGSLQAVTGLVVSDDGSHGAVVHFADPNGQAAKGFYLTIQNMTRDTTEKMLLGYVTDMTLPGLTDGDVMRFSVNAFDGAMRLGPASTIVTLTMGQVPVQANVISAGAAPGQTAVVIGSSVQVAIPLTASSLQHTSTAVDFATAEVVSAPEGLGVRFDRALWDVSGGSATVVVTLSGGETLGAGTYNVEVAVSNAGNRANRVSLLLPVSVRYPPVQMGYVTPLEWNTLDTAVLHVEGTNFYPGTRMFLDDTELSVQQLSIDTMTASVAPGAAAGGHILSVRGPDGSSASVPVTVLAPHYTVLGLKTNGTALAGTSTRFFYTVKAEDRFDGSAFFSVRSSPAGWGAALDRSSIRQGEVAALVVSIPPDAPLGDGTLEVQDDQGDVISFQVTVSDTAPDPFVSSLSAFSGFVGDAVWVYGYGFEDPISVTLGGTAMPVLSSSPDLLSVQVPAGAATGMLRVTRAGAGSEGQMFFVKDAGFSLYGQNASIHLQPGESRQVGVAVSGYARAVMLAVQSDGVTASLDRGVIVPNGLVTVTISVPGGTANGNYAVTLTATSGDVVRVATITVIVGDAIEITTESLPPAMEDAAYNRTITVSNAAGATDFSITAGKLPAGIGLSPSGTLSGKPSQVGTATFTVQVEDAEGHRATRQLSLSVAANGWSQEEMDGGRGRTNPVAAPAAPWTGWTGPGVIGPRSILTGRDRVFVIGSTEALGLEKATGAIVWRLSGTFTRAVVNGESLYLLAGDGVLHVLEGRYGVEQWNREGIRELTTDGSVLVLGTDAGAALVDAATGGVRGLLNLPLPVGATYAWSDGRLLRLSDRSILSLDVAGVLAGTAAATWTPVYIDELAALVDIAVDAEGIVLSTSDGRLVTLDKTCSVVAHREIGFTATSLASGVSRVVAVSAAQTAGFARGDLTLMFSSNWGGSVVAAGAEKVFLAGPTGLAALNGYDGSAIWSVGGEQKDIAIAGEKLFSLEGSGRVLSYNAPDNLAPPITTLTASPGLPDGLHGYYVTRPTFSLSGRDVESYVRESGYRMGDGAAVTYSGPVALPEGSSQVLYWSIDSAGWREGEKLASFQVDLGKPQVSAALSGIQGPLGVYYSSVGLTLSATDAVSGVERIEYAVGEGSWELYSAPVSFTQEGSYVVSYRATDVAGNVSETSRVSFSTDLSAPVVSAHVSAEPGLTVVYLEAVDSGSGVEHIQYSVDGGSAVEYGAPVVLTAVGSHLVSYRAGDAAGQWSSWQAASVSVSAYTPGRLVKDLVFAYWLPGREVVENAAVGDRLYAPSESNDENNRIKALPAYLAGANYIRVHKNDRSYAGEEFARFTVDGDAVVYVLKHKKSAAAMSGWTLVSRDFPVEPLKYFPGGADIYKKSVRSGDTVVIPGTKGSGGQAWPNLIFVQQTTASEVRILLPEPGVELAPAGEVRLYGTNIAQTTGAVRSWQAKVGEGEWQALSEERLDLPYTAESYALELKLSMSDSSGVYLGEASERYQVVNRSGVDLIDPAPGWTLAGGSTVLVRAVARDISGTALPAGAISWAESRDTVSWAAVTLEAGALLHVPAEAGSYYLKAVWQEAVGHTREKVFGFTVAAAMPALHIEMGSAGTSGGGEYSLGEEMAEHASGKIYGFTSDHSDRVARFMVLQWHSGEVAGAQGWWDGAQWRWPEVREETSIALDSGQAFQLLTGSLRVKVTLEIGPVGRGESAEVELNGRSIILPRGWQDRVVTVVGETSAGDGWLRITGSADLPLMAVEVEALGASAPPVADNVVDEDLVVLGKPKVKQHEGWLDWDGWWGHRHGWEWE